MNKEMELNLDGMEQGTGGAVVHHEGEYRAAEDTQAKGDFLYDNIPFNTVEEAEEKARQPGWSTGWFTVRSFEAIHHRKLVF